MTVWRLPDLTGLELHEADRCVLHGVDAVSLELPDGRGYVDLPMAVLVEVPPPLPPEPTIGSVVLVGGGSPTQLDDDGDTQGSVYRHYERGWMPPGDHDVSLTWADLCAYPHDPTLLVPAPDPVELPWSEPHFDGVIGVEVFIKDGTTRVGVMGTHIGITGAEARTMARALWTAADAAEAQP